MGRDPLWGRDGTADFWSARARGEVGESEQRAVDLLSRVLDHDRFSLYCMTGQLPVMGNITKRIYLALKAGGLLELEDGVPVAWWCFSIGPYAPEIPDTDNVVMCRFMVEGEELAFMRTADRHGRDGYHFQKHKVDRALGVRDPFVEPFLSHGFCRPDKLVGTAELLDLPDIQGRMGEEIQGAFGRPQRAFPVLQAEGVDQPGDGDFRRAIERQVMRELGREADGRGHLAGANDILLGGAAQGERMAWRAPFIGDGYGYDMHDGTVLVVDPAAAQRHYVQYGTMVHVEIERLLREGHAPDVIEAHINSLLTGNAQGMENGGRDGERADFQLV